MENNTVEIEIDGLDEETVAALYRMAAEQDGTVDEVINDMLKEYIDSNTK